MSEEPPTKKACPHGTAAASSKNEDSSKCPYSKNGSDLTYHSYLEIDRILSSQKPQTLVQTGKAAHDEMLFIIIHQTYELWFKQILWEVDSIREMFSKEVLSNSDMSTSVSRLRRVVEIQKVLVQQLTILETMTSFSFLDFRDSLGTSSGFQSFQFRILEVRLGLKREKRMTYGKQPFCQALGEDQREEIKQIEKEKSLFDLLDAWLCRMPCFTHEDFDFWAEYKKVIKEKFDQERKSVQQNSKLSQEEIEAAVKSIDHNEKGYSEFFDEEKYAKLLEEGRKRLSHKAAKAAIMINVYQEEPLFSLPFQLLQTVLDVDELMRTWRYKHALMVHRMLGMKVGTGGSSGYHYLKATASQHMVFSDFFDLSMFLIPRTMVPVLPDSFKRHFGYRFEHK